MAEKDKAPARERRLRRAAAHKGLSIRKATRGQDRGRYLVLDPAIDAPMRSQSPTHPNSFSLDEAENYIAE
jgi:hypothetical protein